MRRSIARIIVTVTVAACGAVAWSAPPAGAATVRTSLAFGVDALTYQRMMAQIPLDETATQIHDASAASASDGLVNTAVDLDHHMLTVYWYGAVPANIRTLVASLRSQVNVRVVPTRYSLSILEAAALRAVTENRSVIGAWPAVDGSGLQLQVAVARSTVAPTVDLATTLSRQFGIDVTVAAPGGSLTQAGGQRECSPSSSAGHRCNDWPAFWGGAVINNQNLGY